MTRAELEAAIASYGAGLDAELALLRQLETLAAREHQASLEDDLELVTRLGEQRGEVMAGLLIVENGIKPLRPLIAEHREQAETLAGYDEVVVLHRNVGSLVATILSADTETLRILKDAAAARKAALAAIEQGGQTLTAYRRVITPPVGSAALFEGRG
jgi:hypothetical protein